MFNYSSSNPFSSPFNNSNNNSIENLTEAYQKLEFLKNQQEKLNDISSNRIEKTVFSDIAKEWENTSSDEKFYIENSKEYQEANAEYQEAFSLFLIEKLGNEFSSSRHGKSAEKVLSVIRSKKENYKNKFAEDIEGIKNQNSVLAKNNEDLARTNLALQEQLLEIQKRISGGALDE